MLTSAQVLGPGQLIAKRLSRYEHRPQQLEMAEAVADAMRRREHLVVEAGTGVGKSFAYLVPAILSLAQTNADETAESEQRKRRIVISTHTIALQEQLLTKDIPLLNSVIPLEFSAVLAKGRGNYISLRRMNRANQKSDSLFADQRERDQLSQIRSWAAETVDGSRATLPLKPEWTVWEEVQSDSGNCLGRACPHYDDCFYFKARRRLQNADLIVVNHALFFTDLALRQRNASLLPNYDAVIFDEAHTLEAVASDHLGLSISEGQVAYLLNRLYNDSSQKGLLVTKKDGEGQRQVVLARQRCEEFFQDVRAWLQRENDGAPHSSRSVRVRQQGIVHDPLTPVLRALANRLRMKGQGLDDPSDKQEFVSAADRLGLLATAIENWRLQEISDSVYWVDEERTRRGHRITLSASPIDVGPLLREQLFNAVDCCVLTSATIAAGKKRSFQFFNSRIGLTTGKTLQLGSPFDYAQQCRLVVVTNLADPAADRQLHQRQCVDAIQHFLKQTDGHAFVLFTSFEMLNRTVRDLSHWMIDQRYPILSQGEGTPRGQLLEKFKSTPRSVLFGTDSFWQGVDVPGDALRNVIITKLPFSVPDHPLLQARLEALRAAGQNPFSDFQLPEAVIKFKQGFGRLIRSATDSGMVVVLDPRIKTKSYGKLFLESLPECPVEYQVL